MDHRDPEMPRTRVGRYPLSIALLLLLLAPLAGRQDKPSRTRFDPPEHEKRALGWIGLLRSTHSFDPNRPKYEIP